MRCSLISGIVSGLSVARADMESAAVEPARPMMRRAASFHDDQRDVPVLKPAFELRAREALRFDDLPRFIGHGQLKYGLRQIDGNDSSMHSGFLLRVDRC